MSELKVSDIYSSYLDDIEQLTKENKKLNKQLKKANATILSEEERIKAYMEENESLKMAEDEAKEILAELEHNNKVLKKKLALCKEALNSFVGSYCYNFCKCSDRILSEAREQAKKLLKELK